MCFGKLRFLHISTIVLFVGFATSPSQKIYAQDYGWWNTLVQWDGRSHWSEYLIYTPRFFGPNAIPIPEIKKGKLIERTTTTLGSVVHFSEGDNAQNLTTSLYIPIADNRVGLQFYLVPIEFYQMTNPERDLRFARDFDGKGNAIGDLHISTWVQLTKADSDIDILLTLNLKTASGSNREATRYTDGTGYNFDLSAGKNIYLNGEATYLRPHAQIGLYVWETNEDKNPQNDAFSYGAGLSYYRESISIDAQVGGYIGYKGNGDKPIVFRLTFEKEINKNYSISAITSFGFKDFLYDSYSINFSKHW